MGELYFRIYNEEPDEEIPVYQLLEEITPAILVSSGYTAVFAKEYISANRIKQWIKIAGSQVEKYCSLLYSEDNCDYVVFDNFIFKENKIKIQLEILEYRLTFPLYELEKYP